MKISNFFLISFLLFTSSEHFHKNGPRSVLGDFTTDIDSTTKENNAATDHKNYRQNFEYDYNQKDVPIKLNFQPTSKEEKCTDENKIKVTEPELCAEEVETVKKVAAKWQSSKIEKSKKPEYSTYRPLDQMFKVDINKNKISCAAEPAEGTILCAECEKCEVQVKSNGEGILLRCQECRQVPANEIVFPAGNNRKIIRLP